MHTVMEGLRQAGVQRMLRWHEQAVLLFWLWLRRLRMLQQLPGCPTSHIRLLLHLRLLLLLQHMLTLLLERRWG